MNDAQQAVDKSALPDLNNQPETELASEARRLVEEITASAATSVTIGPATLSAPEAPSGEIAEAISSEAGGDHILPPDSMKPKASPEGEVEAEHTLLEPGVKLNGGVGEASDALPPHGQSGDEQSTVHADHSEAFESASTVIMPATHASTESKPESAAEQDPVVVVGESAPKQMESSLGPLNVEDSLGLPAEQLLSQINPGTDDTCEAQNRTAEVTHDAVGQPAHSDLETQPESEYTNEAQRLNDEIATDTAATSEAIKPPHPPELMDESLQHQDTLPKIETPSYGMEEVKCTVAGGGHVLPPDSPRTGDLFILKPKISPEGEVEIERTLLEAGVKATHQDGESNEIPAPHGRPDDGKQEEQKGSLEASGATSPVLVNGEEAHKGGEKEEQASVGAVPTEDTTPPTHVEPSPMGPLHVEASMEQKTEEGLLMAGADVSTPSPPRPPPPKLTRTQTLPSPSEKEKKSKGFAANLPWQKKRAADDSDVHHERAEHQHKGGGKPFSGMLKSLRKSIRKVSGSGASHEEPLKARIQSKSSTGRPSPRIVSSLVINPPENSAAVPAAVEEPETPITRKRRLMEEISDNLLAAMPPSPTESDGIPNTSNHIYANAAAVDMAAPPPTSTENGEAPTTITSDTDKAAVNHDGTPGGEVVMEGEIEPVCANKPAQDALVQIVRRNQAKNMLDSLQTEPTATEESERKEVEKTARAAEPSVNGVQRHPPPRPVLPPLVSTAHIKMHTPQVEVSQSPDQKKTPTTPPPRPAGPPRPSSPPSDRRLPSFGSSKEVNDSCNSEAVLTVAKSPTHHLPPPPRPSEPPPVSRDSLITCRTSSHVSATPVPEMAPSPTTVYSTASLDRRKLYRSKTETKAAKRATLGRPVSVNATVFTPIVKTKTLKAHDGHGVETRTSTKFKYQRTESFDWPFGGKHKDHSAAKDKTLEAPVARPQLESPPPATGRSEPLRALARASGGEISPVNETCTEAAIPVEFAMAPPAHLVSIGVQVAPSRTSGSLSSPVTTLKHEASPTTLLQKAMEARTTPQRPVSFFKEEFYNQCIRGLFKTECIREENGFQLPYISDRLSEWGMQKMTDLTAENPQEGGTEEQKAEPDAGTEAPHEEEKKMNAPQQALQALHPFLFSMQENKQPTVADQPDCPKGFFVHCLQQYVASCIRLKEYDLQGEFGAFHWITGDLLNAGWSVRGCPEGWPTLKVFFDPVKRIDFVRLPPLQFTAGSLIYPERTLDAMLTGWLDTRSTVLHPGNESDASRTECPSLEVLHPALAMMRLSDLPPEAPSNLLASLSLAILLSAHYCSQQLAKCTHADLELDCRPEQILLLSTPSNCMVIFRLQQTTSAEETNSFLPLLQTLGLAQCQNLAEALEECVKRLSCFAPCTADLLPNLLRALSPPDWLALAISRISLLHAQKEG
ncbi:hypothetical protein AAHC03_022970 [Spirometra sp. Aus1]